MGKLLTALVPIAGLLILSACLAPSAVVVGEAPIPPRTQIPEVTIQVVDEAGQPIAGASAETEHGVTVTDESGGFEMYWEGRSTTAAVTAAGFFPRAISVDRFHDDPVEMSLRPVVLRGAIVANLGFGLRSASVMLGDVEAITDDQGRFEIHRASPGVIYVDRPGWVGTEHLWDGESLVIEIQLEPLIVRGLHIGARVLSDSELWDEMLSVAEETVVNAFVVDVKDESGQVLYSSQVGLAREVGAVQSVADLDEVVAEMDERGLYKIARLVAFQDPIMARAKPDLAVLDSATGKPFQRNNQFFLDPTDAQAREYALSLAEEVCQAGFNEIQFDYVRFPDGYPASAVFDFGDSEGIRTGSITSFLGEATDRLHPLGCVVGADIFGFITVVNGDGGIGQEFNILTQTADVLSPMVYPSHYSSGWFGFDTPNNHPGEVVAQSLDAGLERIQGQALVRPWLQDFYYSPSQVREQIDAAEERSLGWMLWNANSVFQLEALDRVPLQP